jgi:hypothetical protein
MQAYAAAFIEDLDELSFDRLATGARRIGARKLSALYVDFNDGQILVPDRVSESEAADLLLRNRRSIDHLRAALAGLSAEVVEAAHALGPVLETFFGQVIDARAPQEVLAELRQLVHSLPDMTGDEISSLLISRIEEAGRSGPKM